MATSTLTIGVYVPSSCNLLTIFTGASMVRVEVAMRNKQRLLDSGKIESRMEKVTVHQQFETEDGYIVMPLSGSVSMEVPLEWRRSRMTENEGLFEGATHCLTDSRYMDED